MIEHMGVVQSRERREEKLIHATYALILAFQNQCSRKSVPLRDCGSFDAMLAKYNFFSLALRGLSSQVKHL